MSESNETPIKNTTKHPSQVKNYMQIKNVPEQQARDLVARDLLAERANKRLKVAQELSLVDQLTGLSNRRALLGDEHTKPPMIGRLQQMLAHSQRTGENLSLLMVDLDYFKEINKLGHQVGDEALRKIGLIILETIRQTDFAARYGGDEFTIILPNTNISDSLTLANRLLESVRKSNLTFSAGISMFVPHDKKTDIKESSIKLIKEADDLAKEAKENGRNQVFIKKD